MPSPLEGASCAACHDAPREGGSWAAGQNNDIAVICGCLGQIWHEAWLERRQCPCSGSVLLLDRDSINWWIIGYPNSCRTIYGQTQLRSKQIRASLDTWSSCAGELPLPQFSSQDDGDPRTHKIDIGIRGNARPLAGSINNDSCSCLIHATLLWSPTFFEELNSHIHRIQDNLSPEVASTEQLLRDAFVTLSPLGKQSASEKITTNQMIFTWKIGELHFYMSFRGRQI